MGLDTTHNAWHGPYSSFNQFRFALGRQIGINLEEYIGYGDNGTKELSSIQHKIAPLLNHSDCDGQLTPEECKQIADGLTEILETLKPDENAIYGFAGYVKQFRDGCLLAWGKNEVMEFK